MKVGCLTAPLGHLDRRAAFTLAKRLGFDAVELGTGEFTTDHHAGLGRLASGEGVEELLSDLDSAGLELCALSCHGNPLHPNQRYAERADRVLRETIDAASRLGVRSINAFSGCPGSPDGGDYPNWIASSWPDYFGDLLAWQWRERVVPYWRELNTVAEAAGVTIAIEMHPGNNVYNPPTLLRLREQCGEAIGANFDPSHLWWQGIDPLLAVREIAAVGALFNIHAKDTYLDRPQIARSGVIPVQQDGFGSPPWHFTTLGYGHDLQFWRAFVSVLRAVGFDGVLSVEHEDPHAPAEEALRRSAELLRSCIWEEPGADLTWLEGHDPPYPSPENPWGDAPSDSPPSPGGVS